MTLTDVRPWQTRINILDEDNSIDTFRCLVVSGPNLIIQEWVKGVITSETEIDPESNFARNFRVKLEQLDLLIYKELVE